MVCVPLPPLRAGALLVVVLLVLPPLRGRSVVVVLFGLLTFGCSMPGVQVVVGIGAGVFGVRM